MRSLYQRIKDARGTRLDRSKVKNLILTLSEVLTAICPPEVVDFKLRLLQEGFSDHDMNPRLSPKKTAKELTVGSVTKRPPAEQRKVALAKTELAPEPEMGPEPRKKRRTEGSEAASHPERLTRSMDSQKVRKSERRKKD